MLAAIFSLSPAFSSLMNNVTIGTSGTLIRIQPLHVEGKYIKNSLGQNVFLRGINKHGFEDDPRGRWQDSYGSIHYDTWDEDIVADNLDAMRSWGMNFIRCYSTVEFWIANRGNHQQVIKDLATLAAERGIYLMYTFWHVTAGGGQPDLPWPPYCESNSYIQNKQDFVDLWGDIADELKSYPNVLFELWNEPFGDDEDWFDAAQNCIDAIRSTGATNLIVVQWDWGIWMNLDYGNGGTMSWVEDFPLTDPEGNIVYSTHLYRGEIHSDAGASWEYDDLVLGFQYCLVDYVLNTLNKPIIFGEIGANLWWTGQELTRELAFYENALTIFNEWEMGYAAFWWWPGAQWAHLVDGANFQPNVAGEILRSALS